MCAELGWSKETNSSSLFPNLGQPESKKASRREFGLLSKVNSKRPGWESCSTKIWILTGLLSGTAGTAGLALYNGVLSQGGPRWNRDMIFIKKSDLPSRSRQQETKGEGQGQPGHSGLGMCVFELAEGWGNWAGSVSGLRAPVTPFCVPRNPLVAQSLHPTVTCQRTIPLRFFPGLSHSKF